MQNIIARCKRQDSAAQTELYRLHSRRLFNTCLRIIGSPQEAEEVMQDGFMKIFENIDKFDEGSNFIAWSSKIVVRTAIDRMRKQQPFSVALSDNLFYDESKTIDESQISLTVENIKKSLSLLPQGYRMVLSMYLFEGFDFDEIAEILLIQPSTARSQYLRAKRNLLMLIDSKP